ncbi:MAG: hypothetical protein AAB492_02655 [Patescibacteria group bacterium]
MESLYSAIDRSKTLSQLIPLILTGIVMAMLLTLLHGALLVFNALPFSEPILLDIRWVDILIGGTIYLKTSIDFAIFTGRLMAANPGWRNRVAIEIGTAAGNALGTILVIGMWVLLKHVDILLALMVFIASLVLFELAHGSLEHFVSWQGAGGIKKMLFLGLHGFLDTIKKLINPILSRVMPDLGEKMRGQSTLDWKNLLKFSMSVPFILGLDDFAGYVPLFTVVNVYGFAVGVIASHTILNIALFLSPTKTIVMVKNEIVSFLGALAFIGLGIYGLVETVRIISHAF